MKELTYLERLDRLPPFMCRLIARDTTRKQTPLTRQQISERSGLSPTMVDRLSARVTWKRVPVEVVDAFRLGCGITPQNETAQLRYILRSYKKSATPMSHLDKRPLGRKLFRRIWRNAK